MHRLESGVDPIGDQHASGSLLQYVITTHKKFLEGCPGSNLFKFSFNGVHHPEERQATALLRGRMGVPAVIVDRDSWKFNRRFVAGIEEGGQSVSQMAGYIGEREGFAIEWLVVR